MPYDPFERGPHPVGVRTLYTNDPARNDRPLTVEVWYPATDSYREQDLVEATRDHYELLPVFPPVPQDAVREATPRPEPHPLVLFSHGFGSHRRQSTFLSTHLASRGYVVAGIDHAGNTMHDLLQSTIAMRGGAPPPDGDALLRASIIDRPLDVRFMLAELDRGALGPRGPQIDSARIGMCGHSFGGWTTLMVAGREPRIAATVPLAPAGGTTPLGGQLLRDALDFRWPHPIPTLVLAADRDSILPLPGVRELFARIPHPKELSVLRNADHMHFCDRAETVHEMFRVMPPPGGFAAVAKITPPFSTLCPAEPAYARVRGLSTAHFDAHLRGDESAAALLRSGVARSRHDLR